MFRQNSFWEFDETFQGYLKPLYNLNLLKSLSPKSNSIVKSTAGIGYSNVIHPGASLYEKAKKQILNKQIEIPFSNFSTKRKDSDHYINISQEIIQKNNDSSHFRDNSLTNLRLNDAYDNSTLNHSSNMSKTNASIKTKKKMIRDSSKGSLLQGPVYASNKTLNSSIQHAYYNQDKSKDVKKYHSINISIKILGLQLELKKKVQRSKHIKSTLDKSQLYSVLQAKALFTIRYL